MAADSKADDSKADDSKAYKIMLNTLGAKYEALRPNKQKLWEEGVPWGQS